MSYVRIWIHLVFSTKNREKILNKEVRSKLQNHIIENCRKKNIFLDSINGHSDHIHCLISLGNDQPISRIAMLIKGESAYWFNRQSILKRKLQWQDDYFAISVSESQKEIVRKYIANQEKHHAKKSFSKEVDLFLKKYGWSECLA